MPETTAPPVEVKAPEAPKPAEVPQTAGPEKPNAGQDSAAKIEDQVKAATEQGTSNPEAKTFEDLANRGDSLTPGALEQEFADMQAGKLGDAPVDGQQPATGEAQSPIAPAEDPKLSVENPNPPVPNTEQPAAAQATGVDQDQHSLDAQQARLNEMMDLKPEDLQKLAAEGNDLAKKALSDMEKQVSQGAEDMLKQQAEAGQPAAPQGAEQTVPTPPSNEQPTAEQVKKDWQDWEGQAQYKEPSAAERAQGAKVEATSEAVPPPEATPATVKAEAEQIANEVADTNKDTELTPEQKAVEERKQVMQEVQELVKLGVDINSPEGQAVLDLIAENPDQAEAVKAGVKAGAANKEIGGPEGAAAAANATAESLDEQIAKAEKDGNTAEAKKLGFMKRFLKALGKAFLTTVAVAAAASTAVAAAPAIGIVAAGSKMNKQ